MHKLILNLNHSDGIFFLFWGGGGGGGGGVI